MGSFLTGAFGTGNSFTATGANLQGQNFTNELAGSSSNVNQNLSNEGGLANILMSQAGGNGPNPAQLQLQQASDAATKQNAGMIASQRGLNPALAQRQIAENNANMSQQAAGQSAVLGQQEQLGAEGALSGLYGTIGGQAGQQQSTLQQALASYNNAQVGMQSNLNNVNSQAAAQNAAAQSQMVGGVLSGGSSMISLAKGGVVPNPKTAMVPPAQRFDDGGSVQSNWGFGLPQTGSANDIANRFIAAGGKMGNIGKAINGITSIFNKKPQPGAAQASAPQTDDQAEEGYLDADSQLGVAGVDNPEIMMAGGAGDAGAASLSGAADLAGADAGAAAAAAGGAEGAGGLGLLALAAKGGEIPDHLHMMAQVYHPDFGSKLKQLKAKGGPVPGKAKVKGNSYSNDTVPAMLSPGEIVLPRSVTQSADPAKAAAQFVAEKLKSKQGSGNHVSDFHDALKKAVGQRRSK